MKVCPVCREQFPPGANYCPKDGQRLDESAATIDEDDRFVGMLLDDRYKIERRLGQGGMGVVYAARHVVIDKAVAIKILRHEYCRDKGLVQRFIREARAASRIGHPNIVDVTDFGKLTDGHIYFVMEHLMGVTLAQAVRASRGLPLLRVLDLAIQMCHGLAAAHTKGIIHRDLKPENIFVVNPVSKTVIEDQGGQRQDFVKLLDFGIAKFNFGQKTRITRLGSVFGTPQYMSPEQAAGEDADHRGDIYSFGCILYEMVTGEVPFTSDTFMGTLTKQMFGVPTAPRQLRPDLGIPPSLEEIILKMLAKDPGQRYASTVEIASALDACFDALELRPEQAAKARSIVQNTYPPGQTNLDLRPLAPPAESVEELEVVTNERPSLPRRRPELTEPIEPLGRPRGPSLLWVGLGAAVVVGLLLAGVLLWRRSVQQQQQQKLIAARQARPTDLGVGRPDAGARPDLRGTVVLHLHSLPQGAEVIVDGKVLGRTPFAERVFEGKQRNYTFRLRSYKPALRVITAAVDSPVVIVELRRQRKTTRRRPSLGDLRNPFGRKN